MDAQGAEALILRGATRTLAGRVGTLVIELWPTGLRNCGTSLDGNGGDARVVTVHETKAGHTLTGKIIPFARHYEAVALRGFTAEETEALKAMLVRVYGNVAALEGEAMVVKTEAA
jgi:hypothetical protein